LLHDIESPVSRRDFRTSQKSNFRYVNFQVRHWHDRHWHDRHCRSFTLFFHSLLKSVTHHDRHCKRPASTSPHSSPLYLPSGQDNHDINSDGIVQWHDRATRALEAVLDLELKIQTPTHDLPATSAPLNYTLVHYFGN